MLTTAVWTPQNPAADPLDLRGHYTADYAAPFALVESTEPAWRCEATAVATVKQGDLLTTAGLDFRVRVVQINTPGVGETTLLLLKV